MDPGNEHKLSEEEINNYSKELDELFQSLIPMISPSEPPTQSEER